jgi:hypothetical protein
MLVNYIIYGRAMMKMKMTTPKSSSIFERRPFKHIGSARQAKSNNNNRALVASKAKTVK